ncbi:hypothetical protein Kpol_543p7 [Vanderwaltozyma polyspora DSM 70294]|uniref:Ubiquitin-activating enzyme E1-like n=1 Tax=Vanderwaltozyma polyspora (strain ATCC 22028 / DSM 70294 / BCRC 21397 / CBS 2163 / NBRC 10782 / NRRL Y-8283 / UCD 57-17) TaxID=436907 RepID=A7THL2_VANPO|nr:uncharacterized protein Kpol_543p7 [Vanderwaltozyma polyspora DSM 70294]EDO18178.1 hypothetical protein Kpol_543p7 [Vanderwaltozyma polyspora DSM 70294]
MAGRESNIVKIVGIENYEKIRNCKCLLVGAGGIGSELLKDLILMQFGEIHIIDLDTIDLSNLNRQFLFRQKDIKQPKSTTAVKAVSHFSNSKLIPYQGNIMDTNQFPLHWFNQFDIIFNALDNLAARRYVNKIAQFLSLPLLESGTSGFDGYIQPIIPHLTECFDCTKKETPKTFPVCTIRSTPNLPIHCIVWAKNFLFNELFASSITENNQDEQRLEDKQDWGTEDKEEIERIKQETNELHELQKIIYSKDSSKIVNILEKLFIHDIEKLLLIENLWKTREKPTSLTLEHIESSKKIDVSKLKLDQIWSLEEQIAKFINVTEILMNRYSIEKSIEFDKDDEDTLEFVVTAANIRSYIFGISMKSVFDSKQIAGNIIPAIATTNAIIAGLSSIVSLRVLNLLNYANVKKPTDINMAFTSKASNISNQRYLSNPNLSKPNCNCAVCSKVCRGVLEVSTVKLQTSTLGELIELIRTTFKYPNDVSVLDVSGQRLLADFDFDDLLDKTLEDLKLGEGDVLLFTDDEGDEDSNQFRKSLELYIAVVSDKSDDYIKLPSIEVPLIEKIEEAESNDMEEEINIATNANEETIILIDEEEALELDKQSKGKRLEREDSSDKDNIKKIRTTNTIEDDIIELD